MTRAAALPEGGPNLLGTQPVGRLLVKFAIPSIISGLVGALYNIVDQIFIGQGVGMLGNAATNVAFPLTTICIATALLLGLGGASNFSLSLGRKQPREASRAAVSAVVWMLIAGTVLMTVVLVFLRPLMLAFGATPDVLPYAMEYTGITALGVPFFIFATGFSSLIRSDGRPTYSMLCTVVGAVINTILDPLFIFVFRMGIAGAAWATVIGQVVSGVMAFCYLFAFKSVPLHRADIRPRAAMLRKLATLGAAAFFNQLSMTVVQITLNNTLTYYGARSPYGAEIPLAVVGIISKVNIIFISCIVGIAQGNQPIVGFNYGAKQFDRVKAAWKRAVLAGSVVAVVGFLCFQLIPRQIIGIFGEGSPEYFQFAERYFRIYMLMFFTLGIQPVTANFFTSIGRAKVGIFVSLTRQIIFLLPLILIFPLFFGIDGVMYAGPIADGAAAILALLMVRREMKRMDAETDRLKEGV